MGDKGARNAYVKILGCKGYAAINHTCHQRNPVFIGQNGAQPRNRSSYTLRRFSLVRVYLLYIVLIGRREDFVQPSEVKCG